MKQISTFSRLNKITDYNLYLQFIEFVLPQNALGYIGFKVITTCGDRNEYLWTLERNLDIDTHYQAKNEVDYNN